MFRKSEIAVLAAIAAAAISGCGVGEAKVDDAAEQDLSTALPVEISLPYRADIFAMYETTSTLDSDLDAPVLAKVAGEVIEFLVEEGDQVAEGQLLARLENGVAHTERGEHPSPLNFSEGEIFDHRRCCSRYVVAQHVGDEAARRQHQKDAPTNVCGFWVNVAQTWPDGGANSLASSKPVNAFSIAP